MLAAGADVWLNPGWCRTRAQITDLVPSFSQIKIPVIYNNIRRVTDGGGNDFWESGALRADRVLEDVTAILRAARKGNPQEIPGDSLHYFIAVE